MCSPVRRLIAGSFLKTKFTGIAVFVHSSLKNHVQLVPWPFSVFAERLMNVTAAQVKTASCSLGMTQGSKGGAGCVLRILESTVVRARVWPGINASWFVWFSSPLCRGQAFISAHLPAGKVDDRRSAYRHLVEQMGNQLGEGYFQLLEQFNHVVFFGDLNYRMAGITGAQAADLLRRGDTAALRAHDQLEQVTGILLFHA